MSGTGDLFEMIDRSGAGFLEKIDDQKLGNANSLLSSYIYEKMDKYDITPRDIVTKTNISQSHVYQIISGKRGAGRDKLIELALALGLDLDETQLLLTLGQSGTLYPKVRRDAAIICCIKEHMDLYETNECLKKINENEL
ncbi:MAG: helix-turn-helix domain-containing protein [Ruminiclostridium sp.]|nr:helix-turn-helix domain-containing protein [Ruminiclostridium sp.]